MRRLAAVLVAASVVLVGAAGPADAHRGDDRRHGCHAVRHGEHERGHRHRRCPDVPRPTLPLHPLHPGSSTPLAPRPVTFG